MSGDELRLTGPDGVPFATYRELYESRGEAIEQMLAERRRAERLAAQLRGGFLSTAGNRTPEAGEFAWGLVPKTSPPRAGESRG